MMRNIKNFARNRSGSAAIEFGVVGGMLAMCLVSVVDVGRIALLDMQTNFGVEAGALYAAKNAFDATAISQVVASATNSKVVASPSPYLFCGCPTSSGVTEMSKAETAASSVPLRARPAPCKASMSRCRRNLPFPPSSTPCITRTTSTPWQ